MLNKLTSRLLPIALMLGFVAKLIAQDCNPPAITANARSANIFNPEQEMILGELIFRSIPRDLRMIRNAQLQAYINEIGNRLVKHVPPTGLKFQFYIVDIPEANAFNTPGGYVFISRKLIGFANTEDELAGVMAHELGHAVVRHGAVDFSLILKKLLNVTQVGDRKDITEKYNLVLERQRTKNVERSSDHESAQQLEADRIGLFAMAAAGYDPAGFSSLYDRLVETKGKTGSWFSDIFGNIKPEQRRLREMIKTTEKLPAQCRDDRTKDASAEFLTWQAQVVSHTKINQAEQLSGLIRKTKLDPGLRSDISHLTFSPDGVYLLAQDDFAITVIRREPLAVEFTIPATQAHEASFTPDGRFIVFGTETLRFEKWSIERGKPVEVRELVVRRDCWEHRVSPDGRFLGCVDFGLNVNVLDMQTGRKVFEKKNFYNLSPFELITWAAQTRRETETYPRRSFFRFEYSPDSQFLTISRSEFFRFAFRVNNSVVDESENVLLALELTSLKTIGVDGNLKRLSRRAFAFLTPNKVLGSTSSEMKDAGIFSFPDGKRLDKFPLGAQLIKRTTNPDFVILKPLANAKMGVFDLTHKSLVHALNKEDAAIWNNFLAYEGAAGNVVLVEFSVDSEKKKLVFGEPKSIELAASAVASLKVAEVSDNFNWLAISSKTRGGLWNLQSGQRRVHVRGFQGALVSDAGSAVGEFPKEGTVKQMLGFMNPLTGAVSPLREIPESGVKQYGRFILQRESLARRAESSKPSTVSSDGIITPREPAQPLSREVRMVLRDVVTDRVVWSREFLKRAPSFFFDQFSGRVIFYLPLDTDEGKQRLTEDSELAARAKRLGNTQDDYILEVVDAFAGKSVATLLLETGKGSFDILDARSEGDWLLLLDSENRVLSFSIKDGELHQRFFGAHGAINPAKGQIAVENYPGELTVYDLATGDEESRLLFSGSIAFVRFSLDGKRLFVLTDQQNAYAFEVEKIERLQPTSTTEQ